MVKYYGQHGEDYLVNRIFNGKKNGFFVEIGCLDGIDYSNTYFFEQAGWKGICVEAHNDFITKLKTNRKNSTIIHCAVGEKNIDDVVFYANKIGSLSTLDKKEEARWEKNYKEFFTGFEEQHVPMRTLTNIFDEQQVKEIDFISLDIEGYEVQALTGLDLNKYRPRLFIIEYKDEEHKAALDVILLNSRYYLLGKIGCNLFYGTHAEDKNIIMARHRAINMVLPLSDGTEITKKIYFGKPGIIERIKNKILSVISPSKK